MNGSRWTIVWVVEIEPGEMTSKKLENGCSVDYLRTVRSRLC